LCVRIKFYDKKTKIQLPKVAFVGIDSEILRGNKMSHRNKIVTSILTFIALMLLFISVTPCSQAADAEWNTKVVDFYDSGEFTSIAVDSNNGVHIVCYDKTKQALLYHHRTRLWWDSDGKGHEVTVHLGWSEGFV